MTELSPAMLLDIPDPDQGDLNHPAASRALDQVGKFSFADITHCSANHPPKGPLYTPSDAVHLAQQVSDSGLANWCGLQLEVRSHLNLGALQFLLKDFSDPWPLRGSEFGWPLSRDPALHLSGTTWPNHSSCHQHMDQVDQFFQVEVQHGAILPLGPAPAAIPPPISTIPLLCVPKPPSLTKVRVCGDMSFPAGNAVKDGIPADSYEGELYRCRLP